LFSYPLLNNCFPEGKKGILTLADDILQAVEASDADRASKQFKENLEKGVKAWDVHLSLFPAAQRVLNPPFINPHLPKMYRIYRDFIPYMMKEDISPLVQLEITEYAKRPKLEKLPKGTLLTSSVSFREVESVIRKQDLEKAATLMATFSSQKGGAEFSRRLLLLGSGFLDDSLGHSISCPAFILLEMIERVEQDPWPAMTTLADYFCKGRFDTTPGLRKRAPFPSDEAIKHHLPRATSGRGIVNLHHTITLYAIERTRQFFSQEEYDHLIQAWIAFMGDKKAVQVVLDHPRMDPPKDYKHFFEVFSKLDAKSTVALSRGLIVSEEGRRQLGRFLIRGVSDLYQGNYNPHYLTGLGSFLWVVEKYWNQTPVVMNALFQYLDFFFKGIKS
jgi:hypothetical protein